MAVVCVAAMGGVSVRSLTLVTTVSCALEMRVALNTLVKLTCRVPSVR